MAKQRNLSDAEIAIVKAMLRKGWRNDVIHFYFNKPDRLISSGRITQIKKGKYGASVEEAVRDKTAAILTSRRYFPIALPDRSSTRSASNIRCGLVMGIFAMPSSMSFMISFA